MRVTAIIAAGGRGHRLGAGQPKQLLPIGGQPILERSVNAFLSHPAIDAVVVALPAELAAAPPDYLAAAQTADADRAKPLRIVAGGERRQDSVANAFRAVDAGSHVVVVHDAARPFASADLISRTIAAAAERGAAVAALQARDTVKRALSPSSVVSTASLMVAETLPREAIYLAQTPQAFRREVLAAALAVAVEATDEAALAQQAGHPVQIVEGEATNIKITTIEDLAMAGAIAELLKTSAPGSADVHAPQSSAPPTTVAPNSGVTSRANGAAATESSVTATTTSNVTATTTANASANASAESAADAKSRSRTPDAALPARTGRAGVGYDLHRLVEGRALVLGGVTIPSDRGALGHSDADVVCHAITDALLGAAGLGDIGRHFPDTDPRWKDAASLDLLRRVVELVAVEGLGVGNVDVTVILERPKIKDYIEAMRVSLAGVLGVDVSRVSVKGKTNEGVDAVGRGEAIAAHAIALVRAV